MPAQNTDAGRTEYVIVRRLSLGLIFYMVGQDGFEVARFKYKADAKRFVAKQTAALAAKGAGQ